MPEPSLALIFLTLILAILVALQSLFVLSLIRRTKNFLALVQVDEGSLEEEMENYQILYSLTVMPQFEEVDILTNEPISNNLLPRAETVFLFLSQENLDKRGSNLVNDLIDMMWYQADSPLYMVFLGSKSECQELTVLANLGERYNGQIKLIHDPSGELTKRFLVAKTPCAILFDENRLVNKSGELRE